MPALCLGEALVELVCERRVAQGSPGEAFVPRLGGAALGIALTAARHGASVALGGGAGDDPWGWWLRDRLAAAGVDASWFQLVPGAQTALAVVHCRADGEPDVQLYGEPIGRTMLAVTGRLEQAVERCDALVLGSNTLVGQDERAITMAARERALAAEKPVLFAPQLSPRRWRSVADAAASANACVPGALLVCATRADAELLTGEADPDRAALALLKAGARMVVLTLEAGGGGAILRGQHRANLAGVSSPAVAIGVLTGVLLAHLERTGYYPPAVAAGLREALAAAASAEERWGAPA